MELEQTFSRQGTFNSMGAGGPSESASYSQMELPIRSQQKPEEKTEGKRCVIDEMLLGVTTDELPRVSLEGAEIVRRQYLSHIREAMVTIRPDGITFNNSCITKMPDTYYIQMFIEKEQKLLIIRACDENDKDGQKWCNEKNGNRKSRKITGRPFANKVYSLMGWSKGYYYKICGTPALRDTNEDELLFVFELKETECYALTAKGRKAAGVTDEELEEEELQKLNEEERAKMEEAIAQGKKLPKPTKKQKFPEDWHPDSFGPTVAEHTDRIVIPKIEDLEASTAEEFGNQRIRE